MGSISTQLNVIDRMSGPMFNIISAVSQVTASLQGVDGAINEGFDGGPFDSARIAIDEANAELTEMMANIRRNTEEQERYNERVRQGSSEVDGLSNKVLGMVSAYAGLQGIKNLSGLSDSMTQTTARLGLIVDDGGSVDELQDKIFAVAQNTRAPFMQTADMVSKLGLQAGKAFETNNELLLFAEQLNKTFVTAGTSAQGVDSVMLQMTQAMAAGKLQGEELNAVLDNAQPIVANIQRYLEEVQNIDASNIKQLASDGILTANVIKNAMFYAAEETNAMFESMPMTWSQVWTGIVNRLIYASQPLLSVISALAQNWSIIEPIVIGAAVALGAYVAVLGIHKGMAVASAIATAWSTQTTIAQSIANMQAATTQTAFNAALFACPITWIVLGIVAVIAVIYAVVAAINKMTGSTISATGIICGAVAFAGAFIGNLIAGVINFVIGIGVELHNLIAAFANFFANVFNEPVGAIIDLFSKMFDFILGIVEAAAKLIDTVLKTDIASAVAGFRNTVAEQTAKIIGEQTVVMESRNAADYQISGIDYGDAWKAGNAFGEGIGKKVNGIFGGGAMANYGLEGLGSEVSDIAESAGDIADSVAISEEDLKYLRDLAEQETVNRFTTAEITVHAPVSANISNGMDIDGIVDHLATGVQEAMERTAEGVHV